ncbi:Bug family tripartite tricarboxylate transporter substrate binding protein [Achromobacter aloeverae]
MSFSRSLFAALAAATLAFAALLPGAPAQAAYPDKPIRIVVPFPPGGAVDAVARITAQYLTQSLGASVVVDNRPGAGGAIGVQTVARAPANGYELLLGPIGPLTINPSLYSNLTYDTERDFAPIVLLAGAPGVLVVQPSLHLRSLPDFVALLREKPGELRFGSAGSGNLTHLMAEYFLSTVGAKAIHIPYKGSAPAITDFLGGRFEFMFDVVPTAQPYVQDGRYQALAVTSRHRSAAMPNVPTFAELGYQDVDITSWWGLLAPAGTPQAIIDKLNATLNEGLKTAAMRDSLVRLGADPLGGTPQAFQARIHSELARWKQVVEASGAKPD